MFLGIDGGGTHTIGLLADESGNILGRGEAGPSNLHAVGVERALAALEAATNAAFAAAGLPRQVVTAACLGLAGAARPAEQALLRDWANRWQLAARVEITSDAALLLAAGTPDNWGLALIAGTGSIAIGRDQGGRSARAGGWGYLLGDEGSGYQITLAALQAVAQAADGRGPATALTELFLRHFKVEQPSALIPAIYQGDWDRTRLAGLAPLVFAAATEGDAVASRLVDEAAAELAQAGAAVVRQFGWTGAIPLALAGGCLLADAGYRNRVLHHLHVQAVTADPVTPVPEPAVGAVRLARVLTS